MVTAIGKAARRYETTNRKRRDGLARLIRQSPAKEKNMTAADRNAPPANEQLREAVERLKGLAEKFQFGIFRGYDTGEAAAIRARANTARQSESQRE
jgi:hypothetical protein